MKTEGVLFEKSKETNVIREGRKERQWMGKDEQIRKCMSTRIP